MAPDNFDKHIKNKVEDRAIKPSDEAWNKLSQKLDTVENKTSNRSFWWLGIAAGIVGILFFTFQHFNNNTIKKTTPTVVETQKDEEIKNIKKENQTIYNEVANEDVKNQPIVNTKREIVKQPKETMVSQKEPSITVNESVVETKSNPESQYEDIHAVEPNTLSFEDQKVQEVVAQIRELKSNNDSVIESEIDKLLQKAEKQIELKRLYNENTKTVDANSLLEEVEADLERSFRDKVLEALMSSYETVKTAVAQRND